MPKKTKKEVPSIKVPSMVNEFISQIVKYEKAGKRFSLAVITTDKDDGIEEIGVCMNGTSFSQLLTGVISWQLQNWENHEPDSPLPPSTLVSLMFKDVLDKLGLAVVHVK